jgi:hypothetical protein
LKCLYWAVVVVLVMLTEAVEQVAVEAIQLVHFQLMEPPLQ